jgi:DNA invertase Pin-like site-specific DNA recombinase
MAQHRGRFVAYYRVSTDKQGKSGLGLDAQRKAVNDYLNGGDWELAAELTEIESGRKSDRPELVKALGVCKRHMATLVIARLDRLARNVHFISGLMGTKVKFVACDMPEAMLSMLPSLEARATSVRTKLSKQRSREA